MFVFWIRWIDSYIIVRKDLSHSQMKSAGHQRVNCGRDQLVLCLFPQMRKQRPRNSQWFIYIRGRVPVDSKNFQPGDFSTTSLCLDIWFPMVLRLKRWNHQFKKSLSSTTVGLFGIWLKNVVLGKKAIV